MRRDDVATTTKLMEEGAAKAMVAATARTAGQRGQQRGRSTEVTAREEDSSWAEGPCGGD